LLNKLNVIHLFPSELSLWSTHLLQLILVQDLVGERMKRTDDMEASEQSHALRCLALLVIFIDLHLADFVPLVMTLLARALELPALEVRLQALAVWALFVR
jgi:hypothetical protein